MTTVTIDRLIPGGQGIGTLASGKKIFVWGALPGETVEVQITKEKSSYCEGLASQILNSSKRRSNLRDPCYLATSPWQIMDYAFELEQKSLLVEECFRQAGIEILTNDLPPVVTDSKAYFYRNKMEYSLYWDNDTNQIELAFHARGTHRKIPITQSSIERPEVFQEARRLVDQLNAERQSARDCQSILVRCDQQGNVSSALFKKRQSHPKMTPLTDQLLGHQYRYSPNGFFQINLPVYELALKAIQKHIATDQVLDLYAGVGTIGLSVARDRHLTLVETDKSAHAELVTNCEVEATAGRSQLRTPKSLPPEPQSNPILAKSEEVLDFITPDTTVILDPPRAGCHPRLIAKLAQVKSPAIIYLSCNPITQARDTKQLLEACQIKLCQPFNFFPRTPHIENLIVLERK